MSNNNIEKKLDTEGYYKEVDALISSDETNALEIKTSFVNKNEPNPGPYSFSKIKKVDGQEIQSLNGLSHLATINHYIESIRPISEIITDSIVSNDDMSDGDMPETKLTYNPPILNKNIVDSIKTTDKLQGNYASPWINTSGSVEFINVRESSKVIKNSEEEKMPVSMGEFVYRNPDASNYYAKITPEAYKLPSGNSMEIPQKKLSKFAKKSNSVPVPKKIIKAEQMTDISENISIAKNHEESTLIYVLVNSLENPNINNSNYLKCNGGVCLKGYPYDTSKDSYIVSGCHSSFLGTIPFALVATMPNAGEWSTHVPIPKDIIKSEISPNALKMLETIELNFPEEKFSIQFVQMIKE